MVLLTQLFSLGGEFILLAFLYEFLSVCLSIHLHDVGWSVCLFVYQSVYFMAQLTVLANASLFLSWY